MAPVPKLGCLSICSKVSSNSIAFTAAVTHPSSFCSKAVKLMSH